MSKKHNHYQPPVQQPAAPEQTADPLVVIKAAIAQLNVPEEEAKALALELRRAANQIAPPQRDIPWYRQCRICWGSERGVGKQNGWKRINGSLVKTYYKCDKCSHDWSHEARETTTIETIEHREVEVKNLAINVQTREQ
jgi:hypothetical protein